MTLIIKELVIRGIVTKDTSIGHEDSMNKDELMRYMEEMKKAIKKECVDTVISKIESKKIR